MAEPTSNFDRARVDINQDHEVRYWTGRFGVTEEELRRAVAEVGVGAESVGSILGVDLNALH